MSDEHVLERISSSNDRITNELVNLNKRMDRLIQLVEAIQTQQLPDALTLLGQRPSEPLPFEDTPPRRGKPAPSMPRHQREHAQKHAPAAEGKPKPPAQGPPGCQVGRCKLTTRTSKSSGDHFFGCTVQLGENERGPTNERGYCSWMGFVNDDGSTRWWYPGYEDDK